MGFTKRNQKKITKRKQNFTFDETKLNEILLFFVSRNNRHFAKQFCCFALFRVWAFYLSIGTISRPLHSPVTIPLNENRSKALKICLRGKLCKKRWKKMGLVSCKIFFSRLSAEMSKYNNHIPPPLPVVELLCWEYLCLLCTVV
jgi:hypothetical protein